MDNVDEARLATSQGGSDENCAKGKINKDRSEAELFGMNEYLPKKERRLVKYAEADSPPQEAKETSETTPLRERLVKVFSRLKFNVDSVKDTSGTEMYSILKKYAEMDHTQMDCFVCCILSHGKKDEVVCCDNECVNIENITSYFRATDCRSLAGKPKIFFFQACQGSKRMGGWQTDGGHDCDSERTFKEGSIPDEADFLLGFSTTSGYVSFRQGGKGSVYIQTLCEQLQNHAHQYDLLTIMTEVHRKVAKEVIQENTKTDHHKQMPATLNRLRKQFYFNVKQLKD
ncbi:caspase-3-like [Ruditapes philippinarum]|uniref:caspase-3-like n=1 Tax=Ruditapes philippinarum TaxID=129788 RepID=UPI00295BE524|nr:caspase-3-like [Ruditapes philippinarum]